MKRFIDTVKVLSCDTGFFALFASDHRRRIVKRSKDCSGVIDIEFHSNLWGISHRVSPASRWCDVPVFYSFSILFFFAPLLLRSFTFAIIYFCDPLLLPSFTSGILYFCHPLFSHPLCSDPSPILYFSILYPCDPLLMQSFTTLIV